MDIFCDLDGVLVNYDKGMCKAHSRLNPYNNPNNWGKYLNEVWDDLTSKQFWAVADSVEFWSELEPMPDFNECIETVTKYRKPGQLHILTSPSHNPGCMEGKLKWIKRHLPFIGPKNIHFASEKWRYALDKNGKPNILIDDTKKKTVPFVEKGGAAFLVKRPHNSPYEHRGALGFIGLDNLLEVWSKI